MANFECIVTKIEKIIPHPRADRLDLVYFRDFAVVSQKGLRKPGDIVVYCPQDSIIPDYLLKPGYWKYDISVTDQLEVSDYWELLKNPVTNTNPLPSVSELIAADLDIDVPGSSVFVNHQLYTVLETGIGLLDGKDHNRVKPRKLRDFLSEGIMLDTHNKGNGEILHDCGLNNENGKIGYFLLGDDVAEFLGITKYEPEIPTGMNGEVAYIGTNIIPHFDIENIKKYPYLLQPDEQVIVTEKLHGTFFGIGYVPGLNHPDLWDGDYFCYSKGLGSRGMVFKNSEANQNNLYVKQFLEILPALKQWTSSSIVTKPTFILGEIFGKGVQDLDYGTKIPEFKVFDIISNEKWMDWDTTKYVSGMFVGCSTVPVLFQGKYSDYNSELKNGLSTLAKHVREGVVIKPVVPRTVEGVGRVILKDINERYLTRKGGTEYQ